VATAGSDAIIEVIDSGPGIPAELQPRLFDRYNRTGRPSESGGSGLGLSISKSAIEMNGGKLTLASSGPTGSVFRITLPGSPTPRKRSVA